MSEAVGQQGATAVPGNGAGAGNGAGPGIPVENPATGETIATVPDLGTEAVAEMVARARAAQPAWEAAGFEARA